MMVKEYSEISFYTTPVVYRLGDIIYYDIIFSLSIPLSHVKNLFYIRSLDGGSILLDKVYYLFPEYINPYTDGQAGRLLSLDNNGAFVIASGTLPKSSWMRLSGTVLAKE